MTKYTVVRAESHDQLGRFLTLTELAVFLKECIDAGADPFITSVRVDRTLEAWVERNSAND